MSTIPVADEPVAVAVGAGAVWVASSAVGTVSRIDPAANEVVETIETGMRARRRGCWWSLRLGHRPAPVIVHSQADGGQVERRLDAADAGGDERRLVGIIDGDDRGRVSCELDVEVPVGAVARASARRRAVCRSRRLYRLESNRDQFVLPTKRPSRSVFRTNNGSS